MNFVEIVEEFHLIFDRIFGRKIFFFQRTGNKFLKFWGLVSKWLIVHLGRWAHLCLHLREGGVGGGSKIFVLFQRPWESQVNDESSFHEIWFGCSVRRSTGGRTRVVRYGRELTVFVHFVPIESGRNEWEDGATGATAHVFQWPTVLLWRVFHHLSTNWPSGGGWNWIRRIVLLVPLTEYFFSAAMNGHGLVLP